MKNELMKNELNSNATEAFKNYRKVLDKFVTLSYKPEIIDTVNEFLDRILETQTEDDEKVKQAYEMFVKKDQEEPLLDSFLDKECPVDEKVFNEEKNVDDFSVLNLIPEQAKKWVGRLTVDEMLKVITDVDKKCEGYINEDEFVGELVDRLKDMAIAKYTHDIKAGRISTIEDDEIKSEVVDYMQRIGATIPETILSKINVIDDIIKKLDDGEELELDADLLNDVVLKLWTERNNVSIKVHNNKISLR